MEYEVRYFYPIEKLNYLRKKLNSNKELENLGRYYEKTIQFDHPQKEKSFYLKKTDGRFRIRFSTNNNEKYCKLSWKKRLKEYVNDDINIEEEVELNINYEEKDNLLFIINNVLHMKRIESYERYRNIYCNSDIEIVIDEFPFGISIEIENKSKNKNPEDIINKWIAILDLDKSRRYKLSWDDKYYELCKEQKIEVFSDVLFTNIMPKIK